MSTPSSLGKRILRKPHVQQKLQVGSSTVDRLVAAGALPPPFKIVPGGRAVGWLEETIDAWIEQHAVVSTSDVEPGI